MSAGKPIVFAVVDQAVRSAFHADLARHLKQSHGAIFHHYAPTQSSSDVNRKRYSDAYDSFNVIDRGDAEPADPAVVLERARYYEQRYGIPLGWFRITDRIMGLGFSLGGYYHPRHWSAEQATDLAVLNSYTRHLDFWENEVREKNIDVIINGFYFEYFPARANGKQMRAQLSARNENYYFWADTCFGELTALKETFRNTPQPEAQVRLNDAPVLNRKQLDKIAERTKLSDLIARVGRHTYRHAFWYYKGEHAKHYRYASVMESIWREWRALRRLDRLRLPKAADLAGKPYVLYALQVEPESNFQGYSPEYFYQLAAISSLARDIPAGTWLVVKEHLPAAGRRPDLFHEQIQLLKNVIFVDPRESGLELARNARAVATINGTIGQEAAVMGKPVISFGRHNLYNVLDHVKVVTREEDLYPALKWALAGDFDSVRAAADGQRYLAALKSHSFAMADFGFHNPVGYTPAAVSAAAEQLIKSLDDPAAAEPYTDGIVPQMARATES